MIYLTLHSFVKKKIKILLYFFINNFKFFTFLFINKFFFLDEKKSVSLLYFYMNILAKNISSDNFCNRKNKKIFNKIELLFNKSVKRYPDNIRLYEVMCHTYLYNCKSEMKFLKKIYQQQNKTLKKSNKNFLVIEPGYALLTIGSAFSLDAWIKSKKLGFTHNKVSKLILPTPKGIKKPTNPTLMKYFSKYLEIKTDITESNKYLSEINKRLCTHLWYLNVNRKEIIRTHLAAVHIQSAWDKQKRKPLFSLSKDDLAKGKKILKKMGFKKNSWFVTTHVRDKNFKGADGYRDSDINSFYEAFDEIINRGGYVIRMGSDDARPTDYKNKKFIDYAKSKFRSDFMDVFLCAQAKFMLGTSSGLSAVSRIFGVPILLVNYLPTGTIYGRKGDIFIPQNFISRKNNKRLTFKKTMSEPYSLGMTDGAYHNVLKVKLEKNSSGDIKNATKEMFDHTIYKKKYSSRDQRLQNEFKKVAFEKKILPGLKKLITCRIGKDFLEKNQQLL